MLAEPLGQSVDSAVPSDGPVDVVVAHVDGTAPGFAQLHHSHVGPLTPCQMRDNGELRFVLRSIHRHAPWVRRVHLAVMDDGHVPAWINRARVHVVHHADFVPAPYLPTFHWQGICAHLHRIPGLAERFVIFSDDAFLGRPAQPADFFVGAMPRTDVYDSPIVPLARYVARDAGAFVPYCLATRAALASHLRQRGVGLFTRAFGYYLYPHGAMPATRRLWRDMLGHMGEHPAVRGTLERRSRADNGDHRNYVLLNLLFCNWVEHLHRRRNPLSMLARCIGGTLARFAQRLTGHGAMLYATYRLRNDTHATQRQMHRLLREQPRRFCINDEAYDVYSDASGRRWHGGWQVNPASLAVMRSALMRLFPGPSSFELASHP